MVAKGAFCDCRDLKSAVLNDGLEVLGHDSSSAEDEYWGMAFAKSGIESIRIPSTLRVIGTYTFLECASLKSIEISEGLEKIAAAAFGMCGLESIVLPPSVRTISGWAFAQCEHLRSVELNEGLEELGTKEQYADKRF